MWHIFAIALLIFEILVFQIRDLENVDQGIDVQYLQGRHSMANT